ncbi:MAG TPA: diguanylate cyclase, partial [Acidothermaceae bacterium]|nr:diguanylate cyclase [Acidothermaceae bacterium]
MALAGSGLTAWTMDRELRYTWMENPALGFDLAAVIGHTDAELMPADIGITLTALKRRVIEQGETVAAVVSVAREHDTKWYSVTAQPLHDDLGAVIGLAGQATDVTERTLAELELGRLASEALLSERRLSDAQRIAHLGSFSFDVGSGELTWSTEYCRILAVDPSLEPSVDLFMSRVHPDDVSTFARGWIDATERGLPFDIDIRIVGPDAAERQVRVRAVPERAVDGAILTVAGTMMDQTDLATAVEVRKAAEMRFEIGFEQTAIGAVIGDLDGVPTRVNSAACALLGRSRESLIGHAWTGYTHPDDLQLGELALASFAAGHDTYQDERRYVRPDATIVWASVDVTLVRDETGEPQYFFLHLQDITERKRLEDELAHQALHDSLTGLPNRALLADRLKHSLALSHRRATRVGVLFLDLDHFKVVNDSLGHTVGDELLRLVGERITAASRPGDTVARFGGDEFVVVSDDISIFEGEQIAERLLDALAVP